MSRLACLLLPAILLSMPPSSFAQSLQSCRGHGQGASTQGSCSTAQTTQRTLRKCISRSGSVSIQNELCPVGSKTAWVRATQPEQVAAGKHRQPTGQARKRDADQGHLSQRTGTDGSNRNDHNPKPGRISAKAKACETARRYRDAVLKSVGLRRDFDLLRSLNNRVYEACQ